jgi:glycosyltransferase involved in cell wall biosynthesis
MNIAIVNSSDMNGGAARAAFRLFKGLRMLGHDAGMAVKLKKSGDEHVVRVAPRHEYYDSEARIFEYVHQHEVNLNRTSLTDAYFSFPYPGLDLSETLLVRNADIINLHWVAGFQSVESVTSLINLDTPVVWTLHDQNPFTGGCHYSSGCINYQKNCLECPQLVTDSYQIPHNVLKNKIHSWNRNITIVTPSRWLAECARRSRVFGKFRVEIIPNSVETDIFTPTDKAIAKEKFGIAQDRITLLFGAEHAGEKRKGFSQLLEAVTHCMKDSKFREMVSIEKILILTMGNPDPDPVDIGIPVHELGYIEDDATVALAYSAADIYILPTIEDNLPNTLLEAMACGTPVLAFRTGGIPDVIQHGKNGYLARYGVSDDLASYLLKMICNDDERKRMGAASRELMEYRYMLEHQARSYLELYNDLIGKDTGKHQHEVTVDGVRGEIILDAFKSEIDEAFLGMYRRYLTMVCETMRPAISNNSAVGNDRFYQNEKTPITDEYADLLKYHKII